MLCLTWLLLAGRYSDEYGRLNAWWTLDTLEHFVSKAQCFEDQYSTFWLPELGVVPGPNNTVDIFRNKFAINSQQQLSLYLKFLMCFTFLLTILNRYYKL